MVNQPAPVPSQLPPDFGNQLAQWLLSTGATDPGTAATIAERALTSNTGFQLDAALNAAGAQQRADEFNVSNQLSVEHLRCRSRRPPAWVAVFR